MPFNGSGIFQRLYSWVTDATNNLPISSSRMDAEMNGFAAGLSNCLTRDGQGVPSGPISWNGQNLAGVNTLSAVTGNISTTPAVNDNSTTIANTAYVMSAVGASSSVAVAATTPIGAANSSVTLTAGAGTCTAFDTAPAGVKRLCTVGAAFTLKYNATSLIIPGAADVNFVAGDTFTAESLGSGNWRVRDVFSATGFGLGRLINTTTFSTAGSFTYNKNVNANRIEVELVGAGAAGGGTPATSTGFSGAAGGSAGGYSRRSIANSLIGATEAVTVGAKGTGVSNANGNNGGTSSFGAWLSATGGLGGSVGSTATGTLFTSNISAGGSGSGGDINGVGGAGGVGVVISGSGQLSGKGGESHFGEGGLQVFTANVNGNPGTPPGSGGSGSVATTSAAAKTGGNGADGIVIVREYA